VSRLLISPIASRIALSFAVSSTGMILEKPGPSSPAKVKWAVLSRKINRMRRIEERMVGRRRPDTIVSG
jgi:hypothetical protein